MKFIISGKFKMGGIKAQPFKREVEAKDAAVAKEKVFCELGSTHHCPRRFIKIEKIEELK